MSAGAQSYLALGRELIARHRDGNDEHPAADVPPEKETVGE